MQFATTPGAATKLGAAILLAAFGLAGQFASVAQAQTVEVTYATFLDPNNKVDPRVAAQTKMIEAFEKAHPNIKIRIQVDPTQQASLRALRSKSNSPDVFRATNFSMAEYVATGAVLPLDDLMKRDNVSESDWLIPLSQIKIRGKLYGLQQDYRIPILIYRKSLLAKLGAANPPRTWAEVCELGKKAPKDVTNVNWYGIGVGSSGGIGGAQTLAENQFSSMVSEVSGKYFSEDNKNFIADKEQVIKSLTMIRDLFKSCGVSAEAGLQFGANEIHDGLRSGTVAMSTYGLFRYRAIQQGGAGDDLAWAPPPAFEPNGKMAVYGFEVAVNANSPQTEAAWQFLKFIGGAEGQSIMAEGGEVVARASAYKTAYFNSPDAQRQKEWSELVRNRGRLLTYSIATSTFHQALGDAVARMILQGSTPEQAYDEIKKNYDNKVAGLN